jgi:hypothetical protein
MTTITRDAASTEKFNLTSHLLTYFQYSWQVLVLIYIMAQFLSTSIDMATSDVQLDASLSEMVVLLCLANGLGKSAMVALSIFIGCYWLSGRQHAYELMRVLAICSVIGLVILLPCILFYLMGWLELMNGYRVVFGLWFIFVLVSLIAKVKNYSRIRVFFRLLLSVTALTLLIGIPAIILNLI